MGQTSRGRCALIFTSTLAFVLTHATGNAQTIAVGLTPASFQVNESGAATYNIPIQVPPGIAGMEPKLSLAYSSNGGGGQLGLGWHLTGFSSVDRCGRSIVQDTVGHGVTYEASDRYCLDGQRLVLVSGTYGADGAVYATDRESYTKVISFSTAGTGPSFFKAWTKSGQIIEYGNTLDSKVEAQGKASIRTYQVNKISDTKGNSIVFTYNEDTANGEVYPTRIDYAFSGTTANASVVFGYGDVTDAGSGFLGGSLIKTTKRLTSVATFAGVGAGIAAKTYKLGYDPLPLAAASRVLSIQECNGGGSTCLPAHTFSWQPQAHTAVNLLANPTPWNVSMPMNAGSPSIGDINGDGFADILWTVNGSSQFSTITPPPSILIQLSNGTSSFGSPVFVGNAPQTYVICDESPSCTSFAGPVLLADVNGDGRADIVRSDGTVQISTGAGFGAPSFWGVGASASASWISAGDINGDGFADILWTVNGSATSTSAAPPPSIFIQLSNGTTSFGSPVLVGNAPQSGGGCDENNNCTSFPGAVILADVNGDGRADIVRSDGTVQLSTDASTNGGFGPPLSWGVALPMGAQSPRSADINGDGLADILWTVNGSASSTSSAPPPSILIQLSTGNSFGSPSFAGDAPQSGGGCDENNNCVSSAGVVLLADVTGDTRADIVKSDSTVQLAQSATPDFIETFTESLGAATTVVQLPLTDTSLNPALYTVDTTLESIPDSPPVAWPVQYRRRQPMYVVSKTSASDGIGGFSETSYRYFNARTHSTGGGFLGFRKIVETKASGIKVASVFRQDYPFQGLTMVSETTQASGALLSRLTNTWTLTLNPQTNPNNTVGYHRAILGQTLDERNEPDGTRLPPVRTTYSNPDTYGNVQDILVESLRPEMSTPTPDGYTKTTHNEYKNDDSLSPNGTGHWFLGRLTRSTVTSAIPASALP